MNYLSKELIEFGYYTSQDDEVDYAKFFEEHEAMKSRYYQTAVAYDADESVQIPSIVYKYEDGHLHLDSVYGRQVQANIVSENLPSMNLYTVYRMPANIQSTINRKFLTGKFWHFHTVVLKCLSSQHAQTMYIDFRKDEISVIVLKENKLLLAQTFFYTSPDDILYYLLKCCQQLDISQQQVKLYLSGLIEKDSAIYRELYKYFIDLEFETLQSDIKLAEELKIHPEHYFSSISKLASCVL